MNSHQVTQGVDRAPHRSLFFAAGFTEEELERPLIGVVSAKSEIIPGHMHLGKLAEAVKAGIYAAGGTPVEVPAIGVCDGIIMGHRGMHYSLPPGSSSRTLWRPWPPPTASTVSCCCPTATRSSPAW